MSEHNTRCTAIEAAARRVVEANELFDTALFDQRPGRDFEAVTDEYANALQALREALAMPETYAVTPPRNDVATQGGEGVRGVG